MEVKLVHRVQGRTICDCYFQYFADPIRAVGLVVTFLLQGQ